MDRDLSSKRIFRSRSELEKRAAPGGRLPLATAKNNALGDKGWTSITDGSPSAVAGEAEPRFAASGPSWLLSAPPKGNDAMAYNVDRPPDLKGHSIDTAHRCTRASRRTPLLAGWRRRLSQPL